MHICIVLSFWGNINVLWETALVEEGFLLPELEELKSILGRLVWEPKYQAVSCDLFRGSFSIE